MKIVLDTNVFLDAYFNQKNYAINFLKLYDESDIILVFNQESIGEFVYMVKRFTDNAQNKMQDWLIDLIYEQLFATIRESEIVNTQDVAYLRCEDERDNMLVATAIKSNADYILTHDNSSGILDLNYQKNNCIKALTAKGFVSKHKQESAS